MDINNVLVVIDSGLFKQRVYDPVNKIERFVTSRISKIQANQRAAKASRSQHGHALRLYTETIFNSFLPQIVPDLLKERWEEHILYLLSLGLKDIPDFEFISNISSSSSIINDAIDVRNI